MTKKEIRALIRAQKKQLTAEEIKRASEKLCSILINEPVYRLSRVIYPYLAYNQEVITDTLIEQAWQDGKSVAVPKCFDDERMEFIRISSFDEVAPGYCDIPEPADGEIADDEEALIIMPGLAFDRDMNRIGYGGGFYDRYLAAHSDRRFVKVALAYDFQLLEHIETEEHDYKVDMIVTEGGCIYPRGCDLDK